MLPFPPVHAHPPERDQTDGAITFAHLDPAADLWVRFWAVLVHVGVDPVLAREWEVEWGARCAAGGRAFGLVEADWVGRVCKVIVILVLATSIPDPPSHSFSHYLLQTRGSRLTNKNAIEERKQSDFCSSLTVDFLWLTSVSFP